VAFITQYQQAVEFRPDKFNPIALAQNERVKVILACFEPGQFIPVHKPGVDLTLVVMEGSGKLVAGNQEEEIGPGSVAFIPAGEARGIQAASRLVLMHIVSPPPTDADHAQVAAGLQRGSWRPAP
jgi:quercetin dioxygenase-like cupin family protein